MYNRENPGQMTFSDQFFHPDEDPVSDDHFYMKLVNLLDWNTLLEKLENFYSKIGRGSIPVKNMVILLAVKHKEDVSDEELICRLSVDLALQKALNITFREAHVKVKYQGKYRKKKIKGYIDPSSLTRFRERIGNEGVKLIEETTMKLIKDHNLIKSKTVLIDSTVSPSNIAYPSDMHLLDDARKVLLNLIKKLSVKKVRTQSRKARKHFLNFIKLGSKKKDKAKETHEQMIKFVSRNLKQAKEAFNDACKNLSEASKTKIDDMLSTINTLLKQQKEVCDQIAEDGSKKGIKIPNRIVSIFKPYVRPIPRGKVGKKTEFGAKILYESRDSFLTVLDVAFNNVADSELAKPHFDRWAGLILGGDRGFHSKENTELAEQKNLRGYYVEKKGKTKGPPSWAHNRVRKKRCGIEAKFSLLKRCYGLNKNRYSRGTEGEKQWIYLSAIAHNLDRAFTLI